MDFTFLQQPWVQVVFVAIVSLACAGVIIFYSASIVRALGTAVQALASAIKKHIFTMRTLFWSVNLVCMAFSALNGGYLFGVYEPIGLAVPVVLDLLIIVFTQAMLSAKVRGDDKRSSQILWFIVVCTAMSTIANLTHSLHTTYQMANPGMTSSGTQGTAVDPFSGVGFAVILPFVVSLMPFFLVLLACVADIATQVSFEKLDPAQFKREQIKRLQMLQAQIKAREIETQLRERMGALNTSAHWFTIPLWFVSIGVGRRTVATTDKKLADINIIELFGTDPEEKKAPIEEEQHAAKVSAIPLFFTDHSEENKLTIALSSLRENPAITDEELAEKLGSNRPASARFWRLLAEEKMGELPPIFPTIEESSQPEYQGDNSAENSSLSGPQNLLQARVDALVVRYPLLSSWQAQCPSSVTIEQIMEVSSQSRKMVNNRIADKTITVTVNPNLYKVSSVLSWLESMFSARSKKTSSQPENFTTTNGHNGHNRETINLDDYANMTL